MNSISTLTSISPSTSKPQTAEVQAATKSKKTQENTTEKSAKNQYLQTDKVEISEASQKKLFESKENNSNEKDSDELTGSPKDTIAGESADAANKTNGSDIDKEIRELSLKLMELSIEIERLKDKEYSESVNQCKKSKRWKWSSR
jgi:hypothetical protein